jgi:signal peptidase I
MQRSAPATDAKKAAARESSAETPFEALASICSLLVVGLFILTFLAQNYVIPSGSMENTLLVGDHLVADRIAFAPPARWMPLAHYREPKRGEIVVFIRPLPEPEPDADGNLQYLTLVKRLVGVPGDHIHLRDGVLFVNGVAQPPPPEGRISTATDAAYIDNFPSLLPTTVETHGALESWVVELPSHIQDGDLVVPPGKYFMMGDNRDGSFDSRFWGLVPRENVLGRPLFVYWSFKMPEEESEQQGIGERLAWAAHVALHFFSDTRWSRTLHRAH